MPGLFGIVRREPGAALDRTFDRLRGHAAGRQLRSESRVDSNRQWAIGRTHHGVLQPAPQLANDLGTCVLFHGDLDNGQDLVAGSPSAPSAHDAAAVVRAVHRGDGAATAARLQGSHCAAILDTTSRELTLISDRLGSYPLYWANTDRGFVFGSQVRGILKSGDVAATVDPAAVGDCLTFGFPMGTKTLARGVQLVAPGSVVTYRWDSGDVTTTRYAHVGDAFDRWTGTKDAFFDELASAFHGAVKRAFDGDHTFGLALSGGLDSRAILSAINGRASTVTTYTLGADGCADQVIAQRLSSLAGTRHLFCELNHQYLAAFLPNLERMVELTDGMYLSHGLTEMLALGFLSKTGIDVLLRGHGGELAKTSTAWPFHTDSHVRAMRDGRDLTPFLLRRMNYISGDVDLGSLFTPEWAQAMAGSARASLEAAVMDVRLSPPDLCTYLYVTEHHRRSSIPSLELFRESVDVRLPFFDSRFMNLLLRAPSEWRDGAEIHRVLTSRGNRQLLRVRNSNTGAPGDAGPLLEMALDKVNTILRRLNVHGYRHYHEFDVWMRAQLLDRVESVLLDRRSLDRGMLQETGVRALVAQTRAGTADRSFLLLVLLIVEIWQRQNLS